MWCKQCNIETNADICPVCGGTTVEDLPVEVYWCDSCKIPIINTIIQADKPLQSKLLIMVTMMSLTILLKVIMKPSIVGLLS